MFKKLSVLLLALPVISALQLNQPTTRVNASSPVTVTWTNNTGDPTTFDLYLTNNVLHNSFPLKNTVQTSDQTIGVTIPAVDPGSGYTFQASRIGDASFVLYQTSPFDIGPSPNSSLSSSSASSGTGTVSGLSTTSSLTPKSTPLTGTSSSTSSITLPTGSFNGNNGALGMAGIGVTTVGVLVAVGVFFAF